MTFYRLILLIDIFMCLVVTAVCLFFIKVLQYSDLFGLFKVNILVPVEREYVMTSY